MNEPKPNELTGTAVRSSELLAAAYTMLGDLRTRINEHPQESDVWKHYDARIGAMLDMIWVIKTATAANDKVSYHAENARGAHGKDTNDK